MKPYPLIFLTLIFFACSKPVDDQSPNPPIDDPTPVNNTIPPPTTVNTIITAYIETNNQIKNPVHLYINNNFTSWNRWSYSTNILSPVDKYNSNIIVRNASAPLDFFDNTRNFPVISSSRNYVDVNNIPKVRIGGFTNDYEGGEWPLPIGGKITYTPYSFGHYSGSGGWPYFGFLNPTKKFFSITNPSFTLDKDQIRWYLKSFGIIKILSPHPIASDGDVQLEYPIPDSLLSLAPDSIPAWIYKDDKWIPKGYARKNSGNYRMKLDSEGTWNFALPVKGFYKTIKLRTDAGIPVTNAILRIKNNIGEVGSARTDVDGNAICFLPAGEDLFIEIPHSWNDDTYPPPAFILPLAAFDNPNDIAIALPSSSPFVMTIKGNATICNTGPIQNGIVTITNRSGFIHCYIPITNGVYNSALIRPHNHEIFVINALNKANGETGTDTAAALKTGVDNVINLSTCLTATNLFINYSIDGINYSITGDASAPHNPPLTAYHYPPIGGTRIECNSNPAGGGNGLSFFTNISTTGVFTGMGLTNLFVNSVSYEFDVNKPIKLTFTRYDLLEGGYVEGSVDLYYKDNFNISRHVVANFRVKRIT